MDLFAGIRRFVHSCIFRYGETREQDRRPGHRGRMGHRKEAGPKFRVNIRTVPRADEYSSFFLISDTHFDHDNIIRYCHRPFRDRDQMNQYLVSRWNDAIRKTDRVYFLGDMAFGRNSHPPEYWLERLNGDIRFIRGSHDHSPHIRPADAVLVRYRDTEFLLVHDPACAPPGYEGWIIHGHHHNNRLAEYPFISGRHRRINVSAELLCYRPVCIDELFELGFETVEYRAIR